MSKLFEKALKETSLETRILVALTMDDYENWSNGVYHGKRHKLVPLILKNVEEWIKDGVDLKSKKKNPYI